MSFKSDRTLVSRKVNDLRKRAERDGMTLSNTEINNIVSGQTETCLCTAREDGMTVIFPRTEEVEAIIQHYHKTFLGESEWKLESHIHRSFEGITRKPIEKWIANNREHARRFTLFGNKQNLKPVVCYTVNNHHQIDLVDFTMYPHVRSDGPYLYILSVEDIFSRYLWLV